VSAANTFLWTREGPLGRAAGRSQGRRREGVWKVA